MQPCASCGTPLAGSDVLYAEDGSVTCQACAERREVVRDESQASRNIVGAALTSAVAGATSLFFNPIFGATAIALTSGSYAMASIRPGNEQITRHLRRGQKTVILLASGLGIGLGALPLLVLAGLITLWH